MKLDEALAECQRWLDYLKQQEEKSIALQRIAMERRKGAVGIEEANRRVRAIDNGVKVYDGAKLADAVRVLMRQSSPLAHS